MATTLYFRGTHDQLRGLLHSLPAVLAGRAPDPAGIVRGVQLRVANAWLSQVQQDFLTKARGGTGKDGIHWPPLAPSTIAARTRTAKEVAEFNRAKKAAELRGAKLTKLAFFGSRVVDIGIDTRRMFRSLAAGVEDRPAGNPDQVLQLGKGELIIGSNVPYLPPFHKGRPGKQPPRPIVPLDGSIPPAHWPALMIAMSRGVVAVLVFLVGGRR
jgi:hypothetical protein